MSQAAKRKNSAKVQRRKIQVSNASRRRSVEQEIIEKHPTIFYFFLYYRTRLVKES